MNYIINKEILENYIKTCEALIKSLQDNLIDCNDALLLKQELVDEKKIDINASLLDTVITHRLDMVRLKKEHTYRVVENVDNLAKLMDVPYDFRNLAKLCALLHDIGRFKQATFSNTFKDSVCFKNTGIHSHSEYGYQILKDGMINAFKIKEELKDTLCDVVLNHDVNVLCDNLNKQITSIEQLDLNNFDKNKLNIASTLVQMVRDVDKLDIFYQMLIDEIPVYKTVLKVNNIGLSNLSKYYGISENEIVSANEDITSDKISIPLLNVDSKLLEVPSDIKDKYFKNESMNLRELQLRDDYNFIVANWWRLSTFLNDINFKDNLSLIIDSKLLDKLYNKYPDKYKPLMIEAFVYAKELVKRQLENSQGLIYTKKLR